MIKNRAEKISSDLRKLLDEQMFFPTAMNIRPMLPSESNLYKATNFPNSNQPCIGTFLNASWIVILDYFGIRIQSIDNPQQCYITARRASSCEELATEFKTLLDTLVSLTSVDQLFDNDFLEKNDFVKTTNNSF